MNCPLCEKLTHATDLVADLPRTRVFLGENQGSRGWCVLVLREHREHLDELPLEVQAEIFAEAASVARAIRKVFPDSGVGGAPPRINYECLGNQVGHVHWHVIPRHADDPDPRNVVWGWPAERLRGSMAPEQRGELARRLAGAISPGGPSIGVPEARAYRWSELAADAPMPLLERRRVMGQRAMLSRVLLRQGCDVPTHAHANEQFAFVMSGRLRFGIGAEGSPRRREVVVSAGEVLHLPANVPHSAYAEEETLVLDVFSPPSATTGIDRP